MSAFRSQAAPHNGASSQAKTTHLPLGTEVVENPQHLIKLD